MARPLEANDVAIYDNLCKKYSVSDKRIDEHWLAQWSLERYEQVMPVLMGALSDADRAIVEKYLKENPWT